MRRKVEDLAVWLAAGDTSQLRAARIAVLQLLKNAARPS
jgi:tRNA threonylcarbamoyladenosine modification (KEOPS) complex  Pcc1 subunit